MLAYISSGIGISRTVSRPSSLSIFGQSFLMIKSTETERLEIDKNCWLESQKEEGEPIKSRMLYVFSFLNPVDGKQEK